MIGSDSCFKRITLAALFRLDFKDPRTDACINSRSIMSYEICAISHFAHDKTEKRHAVCKEQNQDNSPDNLTPKVMCLISTLYHFSRQTSKAETWKIYANVIGWRPLGVVLIEERSIILPHSTSIISWTILHFVDSESERHAWVKMLGFFLSLLQVRNIGVIGRT